MKREPTGWDAARTASLGLLIGVLVLVGVLLLLGYVLVALVGYA